MDYAYFKFMSFINKNKKINVKELADKFNLSTPETIEVIKTLCNDGYLYCCGDIEYAPTIKGKYFFKSFFLNFINVNIIDILALIVSILAFIEATIALISK